MQYRISIKSVLAFLAVITLLARFASTVKAQNPVYINDNPAYVNTPANVAGNQAPANNNNPAEPTGIYLDQFHSGYLNLQFTSPLYYQFSGYNIFKEGSLPNSLFSNIGWSHVVPFDKKINLISDYLSLYGLAFGADLMYFSSTSESAYSGKKKVVVGPDINTDLYDSSINLKLYFMHPEKSLLHPFFGIGWGIIFGSFKSTAVGGDNSTTSFWGMQAYRTLGTEIKLGPRGGLYIEFRSQTASATTSNDPFDQSSGNSVHLNLDGVMVGLSGYYRF